jgi:hypothetical protein
MVVENAAAPGGDDNRGFRLPHHDGNGPQRFLKSRFMWLSHRRNLLHPLWPRYPPVKPTRRRPNAATARRRNRSMARSIPRLRDWITPPDVHC